MHFPFLKNAYRRYIFIVGSMWMKNKSLTYSGSISVESLYWKFLCLLCLGKQFGKKEKQIENFLIRRLILQGRDSFLAVLASGNNQQENVELQAGSTLSKLTVGSVNPLEESYQQSQLLRVPRLQGTQRFQILTFSYFNFEVVRV